MPTVGDPTGPLDAIAHDENVDLYDYISQFGASGPIKVRVYRKSPTNWKGIKTDGAVACYEHPVSIDTIEEEHGGGKYQIMIEAIQTRKNGKPRMGYVGGRSFDIAGAPKIAGLIPHDNEAAEEQQKAQRAYDDGPVSHALNMAQRLADAREKELYDLRQNLQSASGMDPELLNMFLRPLQEQLTELSHRLAEKEQQILALLNRPPDTTTQDRLFNVMDNKETAHANTLSAMRTMHEAEIRQLREFNLEEIRRRESRFEREVESVRVAAEREIQTLNQTHQQALESQRHGYEMRIESLKDIQARLEREVAKAEAEAAGLRAKKEQGPIEQIQSLVGLKQGFDALLPAGGEEKSGWERALEVIANSPIAEGVMARIAAGKEEPEAPEQPKLIPVRMPDGRVVQVTPQVVERARQQRQARLAQKAELGVELPEISEADMARAISFMESAYKNATDPALFAASARNMLPEGILGALKQVGVDAFLAKVARIQTGSPLATVQGRAWVRDVARFLLGEDISGPESQEADDDLDEDEDESESEVEEDSPVESP